MPAALGYEAAGTIESVGEGLSGFAVCEEVNAIPAFSFADYWMYGETVVASAYALVKQQAGLSSVEAAATWMIRAASSSVELAAIQIANSLGAIPVALTRTSEKRRTLLDAGAAHVIATATAEEDLVAAVARIRDGKDARMAFDPVGGLK